MKAYSIFDKKAGTYSQPFFCVSQGVAIRQLMDLVRDSRTTVSEYPDDFALYQVGDFDDVTGTLMPCRNDGGEFLNPIFINNALDFVEDGQHSN